MYQIIGIDRDSRRVTVATPAKAGDALVQFRDAQNHYPVVLVEAPDGTMISGFTLSRRAHAEAVAIYRD